MVQIRFRLFAKKIYFTFAERSIICSPQPSMLGWFSGVDLGSNLERCGSDPLEAFCQKNLLQFG